MLRVFAAASTVLGVLTGLGTVVGWIGSGSFEDTVNWVFPLAGWAFMAYSGLLPIVVLPYKGFVKHEFRWFQVPWFLLGVLWTAAMVTTTPTFMTDESFRKGMLVPGLIFTVPTMIFAAFFGVQRARASRKMCPDCAQHVRVAARVCQYCGFEWEPRLRRAE